MEQKNETKKATKNDLKMQENASVRVKNFKIFRNCVRLTTSKSSAMTGANSVVAMQAKIIENMLYLQVSACPVL